MREDYLLGRIRGSLQLRGRFVELSDPTVNAVARFLRTHGMIIVCDHETWAVESDTARIKLTPTSVLAFVTPQVPAQPGGDADWIHERSSRSVWKYCV